MIALSKSNQTSSKSLHAALLLSAAASALLFSASPAEAACTLDSSTNTYSCTGSSPFVYGTSLTPSATFNVASGASVGGFSGYTLPGKTPGAFTVSIAQDAGATTTVGNVSAYGGQTAALAGNTASLTNAGTVGWVSLNSFGDLITVTNQASGVINGSLDASGVAGETVSNAGKLNSVYLGYIYQSSSLAAAPSYSNGYTTLTPSGSNYAYSNIAGPVSLTNSGTLGSGSTTIWATDSTVNNSGTINGSLQLYSLLNSSKNTFTQVFLDPAKTNMPQKSYAGYQDSETDTSSGTTTVTGGKASITNSGTINGSIYASATGDSSFTDSGLLTGSFSFSTGSNTAFKTVTTLTNDGTTQAYVYNYTSSSTPVGGAFTASIAKGGEIDQYFTASTPGAITFADAGLIKGYVNLSSNSSTTTSNNTQTTTIVGGVTTSTYSNASTSTPVGGVVSASIAATGEIDQYLTANGVGGVTFSDAGLIKGAVTLTSNSNANTYSSTGSGSSSTYTPVGGTIIATVAKTGEIDGTFSADGLGGASLDTAGLIINGVTVQSSAMTSKSYYQPASSSTLTPWTNPSTSSTDSATPSKTTTTFNGAGSFVYATSLATGSSGASAGGVANFLNEATGKIGASAAPVSVSVIGDKSAVAENDGAIYGSLWASSTPYAYAQSQAQNNSGSNTSKSTRVVVVVNDPTLLYQVASDNYGSTSGSKSTASNSYSYSYMPGTGTASLSNIAGASITGSANVSGYGGASADNAGTIKGLVSVSAAVYGSTLSCTNYGGSCSSGTVTPYQTSYTSTSTLEDDITRTLSSSAVAAAEHKFGTTTTSWANSGNVSAYSSTRSGGDASLINEAKAVIGDSTVANPGTMVSVSGFTSALFNNGGTVYGGASISTNGSSSTSNASYDSSSTYVSGYDTTLSCNAISCTSVPTSVLSNLTAYDAKTTGTTSSQSVSKTSSTSTAAAGDATYTGSGTLYGSSLFVSSAAGNASVGNSGWIGAQLGGGTVTVSASGTNASNSNTITNKSDGATSSEDLWDYANDLETKTNLNGLYSGHTTTSTETVTANSTSYVGGTGSLTNSGTIGGAATNPITVQVSGDTAAALTNSGLINGNASITGGGNRNYVYASDYLTTTDDVNSSSQTSVISTGKTKTNSFADTLTTNLANTYSYSYTNLASLAAASNATGGTLTGNLTVTGSGGATGVNAGAIWGIVTLSSQPNQDYSYKDTFTSKDVAVTAIDYVADTKKITDTLSSKDDYIYTYTSAGRDVTFTNTGAIGYRVNDTSGHTWIYEPSGIVANANGNVALTNAKSGSVLGNISGQASGSKVASETVTTIDSVTTTTAKSAGGNTDVKLHQVQTVVYTYSSTPTGGTATLTNNGSIGQRYADASSAGTGVTSAYGVSLSGQSGASLVNAGLIGGSASINSSAWTSSNSSTTTTTTDRLTSYKPASNTLSVTTVTTQQSSSKAAGGKASISNSATGQIGLDVYNSAGQYVSAFATVSASGQAGATISNDGTIQGSQIGAYSNTYNSSSSSSETLTTKSAGAAASFVSSSDNYSTSSKSDATGGLAVITNTGKILSSAATGVSPVSVTASGFGGATITNAKTGLIDNAVNGYYYGTVSANSWGLSSTSSYNKVNSFTAIGATQALVSQTETTNGSRTYGGGSALVDNLGKITGNASASGYVSGTILNEAGGKILGNVSANSAQQNYSFSSTVNYTGPNYTPGVDTYTESYTWVGGNAQVHNYGTIGGSASADAFVNASVVNEAVATIGGSVSASSLYKNTLNDSTGGGTVVLTPVGGTANVTNSGTIQQGFNITSYAGSTFTNAAAGVVDSYGTGGYIYTYDLTKSQNSFSNAGSIGVIPSTGNLSLLFSSPLSTSGLPVIEFRGNTTASNSGIIAENLVFTSSESTTGSSNATFTFKQGSILAGSINTPANVANANGSSLANLTLNFDTSGLYQGNIYGATATNKTGSGTWILTGNALGLGTTTVSAGLLEFGTPLNYFATNATAYSALGLGTSWDALQGVSPWTGNTAVQSSLQGQTLSSSLISVLSGAPVVTGDITVASGAAVEGRALFLGNMTNNGSLLAGWMLASNAASPLGNLLDSTNQVLPASIEVSGNYTQGSSGTLVTNVGATVSRPSRQLVGSAAGLFAPTSYWLSVAPFSASATPSSYVVVDGKATVAGKVMVYVDKGGLYVNGASSDIMASTGTMTVTATAVQSAPSLFVGFNLKTATVSGKNVLSVVVNRTSYASVATTANQANIGKALDSAVPTVAAAIKANSFASVDSFNQAQDMAGFLSDMDWQVSTAQQAASVLGALSPDGYASLAAIDTGEGFRSQVMRHLGGLPGAAQANALTGAWVQGYGVSHAIGANNGASKLSGSTTGTSLGWDFKVSDVVLGIAGGYARTTFNTPGKTFSGSVNTYQAGAYASGDWEHLYVDGALWANFGTGHAQRALLVGDRAASANVKPSELRADLEGGWRFNVDGFGITPYAGFTFRSNGLDDITETGAGGLSYKLSNLGGDVITPDLGVRFDGTWSVTSLVSIKPLVGLGVEFREKASDITAQFIGGGDAFSINSAAKNDVAFKPEAGLNILVGSNVSLQLGYMGSIGGNRTTNGAWAGLRGNW